MTRIGLLILDVMAVDKALLAAPGQPERPGDGHRVEARFHLRHAAGTLTAHIMVPGE